MAQVFTQHQRWTAGCSTIHSLSTVLSNCLYSNTSKGKRTKNHARSRFLPTGHSDSTDSIRKLKRLQTVAKKSLQHFFFQFHRKIVVSHARPPAYLANFHAKLVRELAYLGSDIIWDTLPVFLLVKPSPVRQPPRSIVRKDMRHCLVKTSFDQSLICNGPPYLTCSRQPSRTQFYSTVGKYCVGKCCIARAIHCKHWFGSIDGATTYRNSVW